MPPQQPPIIQLKQPADIEMQQRTEGTVDTAELSRKMTSMQVSGIAKTSKPPVRVPDSDSFKPSSNGGSHDSSSSSELE